MAKRRRAILCAIYMGLATAGVLAARERVWQTGTWADVQVTRPRFVFGAASGDPASNGPTRAPSITEIRTYTIETGDLRLELKETTRSDMPAVDATVGDEVTFALEKDTVYIKEARGREHAIHVVKKMSKPETQR
jgi:hypothetical protein